MSSKQPQHAQTASEFSRDASQYHRKKRRKWPIVLAVILVLAIAAAGAAFAYISHLQDKIALKDDGLKASLTEVETPQDPYWTLILGSDSRDEDSDRARSDVIMLVRVDPANKQITLVSFPRDTYVTVPGYSGGRKINEAYALGGAELAVKTVENISGIKISHYAEVYFEGFETLVDTLGGITVNVPEYASYEDVTLYPGEQTLNGHEALTLARVRKTYALGDFTRTQCQRLLVSALLQKVLAQDVTQIPQTLNSIADCFSTDMTLKEITSLAITFQGIDSSNIYSAMCPSDTGEINGVSYTFTYVNQWKLMMMRADAGEDPNLTDEEAKICGYASTKNGYTIDMSVPLDDSILQQIEQLKSEEQNAQVEAKKAEIEAQSQSSGQ